MSSSNRRQHGTCNTTSNIAHSNRAGTKHLYINSSAINWMEGVGWELVWWCRTKPVDWSLAILFGFLGYCLSGKLALFSDVSVPYTVIVSCELVKRNLTMSSMMSRTVRYSIIHCPGATKFPFTYQASCTTDGAVSSGRAKKQLSHYTWGWSPKTKTTHVGSVTVG